MKSWGLAVFATMVITGSAQGSDANMGYITAPYAMSNGAILFNQDGPRSGLPACGTNNPLRWAFSASSMPGQAKLAMLLTAYSLHKRIYVHGDGSCSAWGDTETADYIFIEN